MRHQGLQPGAGPGHMSPRTQEPLSQAQALAFLSFPVYITHDTWLPETKATRQPLGLRSTDTSQGAASWCLQNQCAARPRLHPGARTRHCGLNKAGPSHVQELQPLKRGG